MKNKFIGVLLIWLFAGLNAYGQKYYTKTGHTSFQASVEAFEPVAAKSESTTAVLNAENGEVAVIVFIKSFQFKVALMKEHFNENYMDSDQFPKATLNGMINDFDMNTLSDMKAHEFLMSADLTIKGITKQVRPTVRLTKNEDSISVATSFIVSPADFQIDIPGIVKDKIAEEIKIDVAYELGSKK